MAGRRKKKLCHEIWSPAEREKMLDAAIAITASPSIVPDPDPVLPRVLEARLRDAAARERLRTGKTTSEPEPQADFATRIRTAELAGNRRRRR